MLLIYEIFVCLSVMFITVSCYLTYAPVLNANFDLLVKFISLLSYFKMFIDILFTYLV